MHNWQLKISSLAIAIFLAFLVNYFFANNEGNKSVLQFIVPVEVKNVPSDKMIIWPPARQAEVAIQGPSIFLSRIASQPPVFRVSFPPDVKNQFVANLRQEDLNLPRYVQVLSIKPDKIDFRLDDRGSKKVAIEVPRIGSIPDSLKLEEIRINPNQAEIKGPLTEIKGITSIETYPLDLRDVQNDTTRELDIRAPGTFSETDVKRIEVSIRVSSVQLESSFKKLAIELRSAGGEGYRVQPAFADVTVSAAKDLIKTLKAEDIIPYVRMNASSQPPAKLKVAVDLPRGITSILIEPEEVQLVKFESPERAAPTKASVDKPPAPRKAAPQGKEGK